MDGRTIAASLLLTIVVGVAVVDEDVAEDRSLAHANCFGLPADHLAADGGALLALLSTEGGRRAAKDLALRSLLANTTEERAAFYLQGDRAISVCGNSWLDWLPWLLCRVQSPPPRLDFEDEQRGGDAEAQEPLCRLSETDTESPRGHVTNPAEVQTTSDIDE